VTKLLSYVPGVPKYSPKLSSLDSLRTELKDYEEGLDDKQADYFPSVVYDLLDSAQTNLCLHDELRLSGDEKRPVECKSCGRQWMVVGEYQASG
jgi:hypothetical protein